MKTLFYNHFRYGKIRTLIQMIQRAFARPKRKFHYAFSIEKLLILKRTAKRVLPKEGLLQDIIGNRYRLLTPLGKGGTAGVYLAFDPKTEKYCAVKIIKHNMDRKETRREAGEKYLVNRLYHPALPEIRDYGEEKEYSYVVMDYVEGIPLSRVGKLPPEQVIRLGKQLCKVLIYLHSRYPPLIYRDLKPENILLQPDGNIKLIDFGTVMPRGKQSRNDRQGTRGYAAPEQYCRYLKPGVRTDVYCLGMTLHVLLTGHKPEESKKAVEHVRKWDPKIPKRLDAIVAKCTRKNSLLRYGSCKEVLRDLDKKIL